MDAQLVKGSGQVITYPLGLGLNPTTPLFFRLLGGVFLNLLCSGILLFKGRQQCPSLLCTKGKKSGQRKGEKQHYKGTNNTLGVIY